MRYFILIVALSFVGCSQNQIDSERLCNEFYELNKDKDFEGLFDVAMGGRRGTSVYDETSNQYAFIFYQIDVYNTETEKFDVLPVFKRKASLIEQDSAFQHVSHEARNVLSRKYGELSESELFHYYIEYVNMLYEKYDNIKTPQLYSSKNVIVEGNPRNGEFITFTLNKQCKVYYISNPDVLKPSWRDRLIKMSMIDNNWYYQITQSK